MAFEHRAYIVGNTFIEEFSKHLPKYKELLKAEFPKFVHLENLDDFSEHIELYGVPEPIRIRYVRNHQWEKPVYPNLRGLRVGPTNREILRMLIEMPRTFNPPKLKFPGRLNGIKLKDSDKAPRSFQQI